MTVPGDSIEEVNVGALTMRFLVDSKDSDGALGVFEVDVPVGARVPAPHSHDGFEETIYGLDGVTVFTVEGVDHAISPGTAVAIKRGQIHGFENRSDSDARFLAIVSPAVFGPGFFREMGAVMAAAVGPPDKEAIFEVMKNHGLTPAPSL